MRIKVEHMQSRKVVFNPDDTLVMIKIKNKSEDKIYYLVRANWPTGCNNQMRDASNIILYQHPDFSYDKNDYYLINYYWLEPKEIEEFIGMTNRDHIYLLKRR
jgi:hypothetical protein